MNDAINTIISLTLIFGALGLLALTLYFTFN